MVGLRFAALSYERQTLNLQLSTFPMSEVRLEAISKIFPDGIRAVHDISLSVPDGSFTVLVGPSGCGKTTTLRLIAGLDKPTSGGVFLSGRDVGKFLPHQRNVGMVIQQPTLYPHMTVRRNLDFLANSGGWFSSFRRKSARFSTSKEWTRVRELLGLEPLLSKYPYELSGGEQQRVALGRAVLRRPDILLLDEPLSHLDPPIREELRIALKELHRQTRMTILHVTHDPFEAVGLGDQLAVLRNGQLEQVGSPKSLLDNPKNLFVARFLGWPPPNVVEGDLLAEGETTFFRRGSWKLPLSQARVTGILYAEDKTQGDPSLQSASSSVQQLADRALSMRVQIVFRPSAVHLERGKSMGAEKSTQGDPTLGKTCLECKVDVVEEYGGIALATLTSLADGLSIRSLFPMSACAAKWPVGQRVLVTIAPSEILLFDSQTGRARGT